MSVDGLRGAMRKERLALSDAQREQAAGRCARLACALQAVRRARCVAGYMAHRGEISCEPIIEWVLGRGASVLLPVVTGRRMKFAPYAPGELPVLNRWGIPEPEWCPRHWLGARRPSVVLVPLVAFDSRGNRLGQGGGYYDRTFAFRNGAGHWQRPLLAGLAYEFQRVEALCVKRTDVPLDAVITERRIYEFRRRPEVCAARTRSV